MASAKTATITCHAVSSLDGFIARKDNTLEWLEGYPDDYDAGISEPGAEESAGPDCYVLGSRTYEDALKFGWPYGDTPTLVLTHRPLTTVRKNVEFHSGDLKKLIDEILAPRFASIWVVGGAVVIRSFLKLGLVDEIRLTVAPILLGDGLHLFGSSFDESRWRLRGVTTFRNGFVDLRYGCRLRSSA